MEHLQAVSLGGKKSDENAVVCCKDVNTWLGSRSVKEKFEVVLNHSRESACLAPILPKPEGKPEDKIVTQAEKLLPEVLTNLSGRGTARPKTTAKLKNSLATTFKKTPRKVIEAVLVLLKKRGYTTEKNGTLSYPGL